MFETLVGVVTIAGVLLAAADFVLRWWFHKSPAAQNAPKQKKAN